MGKINIPSNGCCTFSDEILEKLYASGLKRRKKISYKLYTNNRELQLECPLIKSPDHENIVLWPAFKLPYRKYPVYVYLYAAALYLSTDLSMRKVAAKVRKTFGLDKFSHSTVSRSLKKLTMIIEELFILLAAGNNNVFQTENLVPRKKWDTTRMDQYRKLLHILLPILNRSQTEEYGSLLNYRYFRGTKKFIL